MKYILIPGLLMISLLAIAQTRPIDSTSLLYNKQKGSTQRIKSQKQVADSFLNHKDTSWKRDNWVPDLDDKKKPARKK